MNFQTRKKSIFTGILMLVVALTTLISSSFMMLSEQRRVDHHMEMASNAAVAQVNEKLYFVQNAMDMIASGIMTKYSNYLEASQRDNRNEMVAEVKEQALYALSSESLAYATYFRLSMKFSASSRAGFFCGYDDSNKIVDFEITDLSKYEATDMEHVGWYYMPVNYGHSVWMEPYYNANKEVCMISYVVPVYIQEQLVGILGMDIDVEDLLSFVNRLEDAQNYRVVITDRSDNVLPGMAIPSNSGRYVEASGTLANGMKLTVYESKSTIFVIRYHFAFYIAITACLILLIFAIVYLINIQKNTETQTTEKQKILVLPLILGGLGLVSALGLFVFYQVASGRFSQKPTQEDLQPNNVYSQTITVVAEQKYEPYSFYDQKAFPSGYDVALIYEAADLMQVNVNLKLMSWSDCITALRTGEADVILGLDISTNGKDNFLRSDVTSSEAVMIYGRTDIKSATDILGKPVATVNGDDRLDPYGLLLKAKGYDTIEDCFHALLIGKVEYVIADELVAERAISSEEFSDIHVVYKLMQSDGCFGVSKKNQELLDSLNYAISTLRKTGRMDELEKTYLTEIKTTNVFGQYSIFFYVSIGVIVLLFVSAGVTFFVQRTNRRLRRLSETDALTGINNRGGGEAKIRALIHQKIPGMFCMFDVDKFKSINDTYGHGVGDQVLMAIADCMKLAFRDRDIIMRLGGDEFAVYVPQVCDKETGTKVIERFFEEVHLLQVEDLEGHEIHVSLGATFYLGAEGDDFASIYLRADKGTYVSKKMIGNTYHFEVEE